MKLLITGANSMVTKSIKEHLETHGHNVFLTSSDISSEHIKFDLCNPAMYEDQLDNLLKEGLDAVILCAATPTYKLLKTEAIPWEDAEKFVNANIMGNFWLIRKVLPIFKKQNFGRMIFISSMTTTYPVKGYSVYSIAKAGIEALMKYVAHEYGGSNIIANTIRLGVFHTKRNDKYLSDEKVKKKIESSVALSRLGNLNDLNPVIDMLIHPNCYVQGTVIEVSGGTSNPV